MFCLNCLTRGDALLNPSSCRRGLKGTIRNGWGKFCLIEPNSFWNKFLLRLSESNHQRLEIGSGTLELKLDEGLEDRINFWSEIWSELNPVKRTKTSKSWTNPKAYRKDLQETPDQKVEL